jgi:anti-sigma regulatory factor (Ser/Thr protein kinase)
VTPYVSCGHCDASFYTAARYSSVDECPGCGATVVPRRNGLDGVARLDRWFPGNPQATGAARHAVDELSDKLHPALLEDLRLLVSELVTNSVQHGPPTEGKPNWLQLSISNGYVRAQVQDCGPGFVPTPSLATADAESGRGLYLVDQIANQWGVTPGTTTCVWLELDRGRYD